jgi:hypothetical protein
MTLTASLTRLPSTVTATRTVDVTQIDVTEGDGPGDSAVRACWVIKVRRLPSTVPWTLAATTAAERAHRLGSAPPALRLTRHTGRGRHARWSAWALGPATRGAA